MRATTLSFNAKKKKKERKKRKCNFKSREA
jgi:hypothetical protein